MSEAAALIRGTIVQVPGENQPGLIVADGGKQIPFHLAGVWQSTVAPATNQSVEIALDPEGMAIRIAVVDVQTLAKEKFDKAQALVREKFRQLPGGQAGNQSGAPADAVRTYAARMGKYAMICCAALIAAWFGLSVASVTGDMFGSRKGLSVSDLLGLASGMRPSGHLGFFGFLGLVAVLLPWAAPLVRSRVAGLFFCAPLAMLIVANVRVVSLIKELGQQSREAAKMVLGMMQPKFEFGLWIVLAL